MLKSQYQSIGTYIVKVVVNNIAHRGDLNMTTESDQPIPTEKEAVLAFNMGLQTAIYLLEKAEELSAEGRRYLINPLNHQLSWWFKGLINSCLCLSMGHYFTLRVS